MIKKISLIFGVCLLLVGCSNSSNNEEGLTDVPQNQVIEGNQGEYSIITPFVSSPLRQIYSQNYREIDTLEIGRRLQDKSKEYFSTDDYLISEGSIINIARYNELVTTKSSNNPYGLNPERNSQPFVEKIKDSTGKIISEVTIPNPRFVKSLYELNFYKDSNREEISGISIAVVLNRYQISNPELGLLQEISDDSLFQVANDMIAVQLNAYLRTLSETKDVPVMIAFYVQNSSTDNLTGNYLPGTYIGHGLFEGGRDAASLTRDNEAWFLLNSNDASTLIPESYHAFFKFQNEVADFLRDENTGVVGSTFTINNEVKEIDIAINLGAKTELEIYGLTQFVSQKIMDLNRTQVPITIRINMFQNTRATVTLRPGSDVHVQFLY